MAKSRSLQQAVRFALATTAAAGITALHAQEAPAPTAAAAPVEEIVVTGSRLSTPNQTAISPVTTVSAVDIQQTGLTRVEDVLNTMPQVFAGMNSTTSNGADGTAAVDLRGLGNARTLTLVDGLRLGPGSAFGGRSYSDINQIPAALIERVDVLTGGASSVYGADAVAGVVNFILNTHFEGVKVEAGYHFNQHNNDDQAGVSSVVTAVGDPLPPSSVNTAFGKNASVIIGSNFAENKGNATAYVTYDNQGSALQNQFDYSACTLGALPAAKPTSLACAGSSTAAKNGAGGRFLAYSTNGVPFVDNTVDGKTGLFRPFAEPADLYNFGPLNYFQTPNERWTAGAFLNYELTEHVNVYTSIMYMRNNQSAQIAPSGSFGQPAFIPCADPLLNASEAAVVCNPANQALQGNPYEVYNGKQYAGLNMYLLRRNVEGGDRIAAFVNNSSRQVLGIKGDFADGVWTYDLHAQHGTVDNTVDNQNYLDNLSIQQALNVLPGGPGKAPVCGGPTNAAGTQLVTPGTAFSPNPSCVPWNVWSANGVTQAQLASLSIPLLQTGSVVEYVANGSVTGDLGKYGLKLPTANDGLQLNVGAEWREEGSSLLPDYASQLGIAGGIGGPVPPISGEFTVKEIFTEMRLPLAQHMPFADDLSLEGGYRYSKYSEGFDTNTYKLGVDWAPLHDFRLRGSYQRAVRAPNVGELYAPVTVGLDGSIDPCAAPLANPNNKTGPLINGLTLAQCLLTYPKNEQALGTAQYGSLSPNSANQYNGQLGGNPHLTPEVADTVTIGVVLTPRWVPNLSVTVDYFDIKIANAIGPRTGNAILLGCIDSGGVGTVQYNEFCPLIHRDPGTGSLWLNSNGYVIDPSINLGEIRTEGFDVKANYRQPLAGLGSLLFSVNGTRQNELVTEPVPGLASYNCTGLFGATCGGGNPVWRSVVNVAWTTPWDGLDLSLRWRYFGPSNSELTSGNPFLAGGTQGGAPPYAPLSHIPAYSYFDLQTSFDLSKNVRMQLGVNNITDKVPPLIVNADCSTSSPSGANCNGNTFPGAYDAMGRYLFATVSAQF